MPHPIGGRQKMVSYPHQITSKTCYMIKIYHNPRCSKSRQTLALLEEYGIEPEVIEYLKTPLTAPELNTLAKQLNTPLKDMVRTTEADFKATGLNIRTATDDELIEAIAHTPKIMQRPIVTNGQRAVIGRPPENILDIIK